MVNELIILNI